jgi:hypothetical protein
MPAQLVQSPTAERMVDAASGWPMLAFDFALLVGGGLLIGFQNSVGIAAPWLGAFCVAAAFLMLIGFSRCSRIKPACSFCSAPTKAR